MAEMRHRNSAWRCRSASTAILFLIVSLRSISGGSERGRRWENFSTFRCDVYIERTTRPNVDSDRSRSTLRTDIRRRRPWGSEISSPRFHRFANRWSADYLWANGFASDRSDFHQSDRRVEPHCPTGAARPTDNLAVRWRSPHLIIRQGNVGRPIGRGEEKLTENVQCQFDRRRSQRVRGETNERTRLISLDVREEKFSFDDEMSLAGVIDRLRIGAGQQTEVERLVFFDGNRSIERRRKSRPIWTNEKTNERSRERAGKAIVDHWRLTNRSDITSFVTDAGSISNMAWQISWLWWSERSTGGNWNNRSEKSETQRIVVEPENGSSGRRDRSLADLRVRRRTSIDERLWNKRADSPATLDIRFPSASDRRGRDSSEDLSATIRFLSAELERRRRRRSKINERKTALYTSHSDRMWWYGREIVQRVLGKSTAEDDRQRRQRIPLDFDWSTEWEDGPRPSTSEFLRADFHRSTNIRRWFVRRRCTFDRALIRAFRCSSHRLEIEFLFVLRSSLFVSTYKWHLDASNRRPTGSSAGFALRTRELSDENFSTAVSNRSSTRSATVRRRKRCRRSVATWSTPADSRANFDRWRRTDRLGRSSSSDRIVCWWCEPTTGRLKISMRKTFERKRLTGDVQSEIPLGFSSGLNEIIVFHLTRKSHLVVDRRNDESEIQFDLIVELDAVQSAGDSISISIPK